MTKTVIVILGPTAVGKTNVAVKIAKKMKGEIISADARQIYKYMDIGTNKPSKKQLAEVPHHLIDVTAPTQGFNAGAFVKSANKKIKEIFNKGKVPIIVGGTGFYIKALMDGLIEVPRVDKKLRLKIGMLHETKGLHYLYKKLTKLDPEIAKTIDKQNPARVLRAIEICLATGKKFSELKKETKKSEYNFSIFGLSLDRKKLYDKINSRVDKMIKNGLIQEVRKLVKRYSSKNMVLKNTIGYSEIIAFFNGKLSMNEAIHLIKQNTRHYAKRQMTWFNRDSRIIWVDSSAEPSKKILKYLKKSDTIHSRDRVAISLRGVSSCCCRAERRSNLEEQKNEQ